MSKAKDKITFLRKHGATKLEALVLVVNEQDKDLRRLERHLKEATQIMTKEQNNEFFGLHISSRGAKINDV